MRLAEPRIDWRVVFKPLGILTDGLRALGGLLVFVFHDTLPRTFQSQGVAIDLNKTIDEVYPTLVFTNPLDAVVVEHFQIARLVILDEQLYDALLTRILGNSLCLLQPIDNMADGITITTIGLPDIFTNDITLFDECGVQAIGRWCGIAGILSLPTGIERLSFLLRHAVIEVAGRGLYQVSTISLIDALGKYRSIEDDGEQLVAQLRYRLTRAQRQSCCLYLLQDATQIVGRKTRLKLLRAIMMVDAVREPDPLEIDLQSTEVGCVVVNGQIRIDRLQHLANAEVIFSKLVESNVAPIERGFRQVINQLFLQQRQLLKSV